MAKSILKGNHSNCIVRKQFTIKAEIMTMDGNISEHKTEVLCKLRIVLVYGGKTSERVWYHLFQAANFIREHTFSF